MKILKTLYLNSFKKRLKNCVVSWLKVLFSFIFINSIETILTKFRTCFIAESGSSDAESGGEENFAEPRREKRNKRPRTESERAALKVSHLLSLSHLPNSLTST